MPDEPIPELVYRDPVELLEEYKNYLQYHEKLQDSTRRLYARAIKRFLSTNPEVTVEAMNIYVTDSITGSAQRCAWLPYAFKPLLKMLKMGKRFDEIVKRKTMPKLNKGVWLTREQRLALIGCIKREESALMAMIQNDTAARTHEVAQLRVDDVKEVVINLDGSEETVYRFTFLTKGMKMRNWPLVTPETSKRLAIWLVGRTDFLFLMGKNLREMDLKETTRKAVQRTVRYYNRDLGKAAELSGFGHFASHDFRRSVNEDLKKAGKGLEYRRLYLDHARAETTLRYDKSEPVDPVDAMSTIRRAR